MSLDPNESLIAKKLHQVADYIRSRNQLNLHDATLHAETLFAEVLNILYDWNLVNNNDEKANADAIDLHDKKAGLAVQVTSTSDYSGKYKSYTQAIESKQKDGYKKFYLLYIGTVDKKFMNKKVYTGYTYEGLDIVKLMRIIAQHPIVADREKIFAILNYYYGDAEPKKINPSPYILLRRLDGPRDKNAVSIDRSSLLHQLFAFTQEGHRLITGDPGVGKSFLMDQLHHFCWENDTVCALIRIDKLIEATDEEIAKRLGLAGYWLETLTQLPPLVRERKNVLIFDAFDTARDWTLRKKVILQIEEAMGTLGEAWTIIVTCRLYDAQKSAVLKNLFAGESEQIPPFTTEELKTELQRSPALLRTFERSTPSLQQILTIPFFLNIFDGLVMNNPSEEKQIEAIETEEQLLAFFWDQKIEKDSPADFFLDRLTRHLARSQKLTSKKSDWVNAGEEGLYSQLVSEGILSGADFNTTSAGFRHNIIFDYALSRYVIEQDAAAQVTQIQKDEKFPFLFIPSYIHFYSRLWRLDRKGFWEHFTTITAQDQPVFRLFSLSILYPVLGSVYKTSSDLQPVMDITDVPLKNKTINKLLEGLRFINRSRIRPQDIDLLVDLCGQIEGDFIAHLGYHLNQAIEWLKQHPDERRQKKMIAATNDYLQYVLTQRKTNNNPAFFDWIGSRWAIENTCRCYRISNRHGKQLLLQVLDILKEENFPIGFFSELSEHVSVIAAHDPAFAAQLYLALYRHNENSDTETFMKSAALTLRSNRGQDYHVVQYRLEKDFDEFLKAAPATALDIAIRITDPYVKDKSRFQYYQGKFSFMFLNRQCTLMPDYFNSNSIDSDDGEESHITKTDKYLQALAGAREWRLVQSLLEVLITHAQSSVWWNIMIRLCQQYPGPLKKITREIVLKEAFYLCSGTQFHAGELLRTGFEVLSKKDRITVENMILQLREDDRKNEPPDDWMLKIRRKFLGCIPEHFLQVTESKLLIEKTQPVKNERPAGMRFITERDRRPGEDMMRAGLDPADAEDVRRFAELEQLRKVHVAEIVPEQIDPSHWQLLVKLYEEARTSIPEKKFFRLYCNDQVAKALLLWSAVQSLDSSQRESIARMAVHLLQNPEYLAKEYTSGKSSHFHIPQSQHRYDAVTILYRLLRATGDQWVAEQLLQAIDDNDPSIRYNVITNLSALWVIPDLRPVFWETMKTRLALEQDGNALRGLLHNITFDDILEQDTGQIKDCIDIIDRRFDAIAADENLVREYAETMIMIWIRKHEFISPLLHAHLDQHAFRRAVLFHTLGLLGDGEKEVIVRQDGEIIEFITVIVNTAFDDIKAKGVKSGEVNDAFSTINDVVDELHVIVSRGWKKKKDRAAGHTRVFFDLIRPLMNQLITRSLQINNGLMIATTAYHFIDLLHSFLSIEPQYVLDMLPRIVTCGAADNLQYDHSAIKKTMTIIEEILVDHRQLLDNKKNFGHLLTLLDYFSSAGALEALELTWRLKEIIA